MGLSRTGGAKRRNKKIKSPDSRNRLGNVVNGCHGNDVDDNIQKLAVSLKAKMITIPKWTDKIHDSEKIEQCIYDLCFNPDGSQLIVACGSRVLCYDTANGTLEHTLKSHKDNVYCLAYARSGQKFASGSADKTVIVWSNKLEGLLKYSHGDAVQCLAFNPLSQQLASCALSDFAFWSTEQKQVQKYKVPARVNSCSWTNDGQYLALGMSNGVISIRNKMGEEKMKIERPGNPAIWAISWNPNKDDSTDTLCVTDWNHGLSFYTLGGELIGKERQIGFDALKVRYFAQGEYILICGTSKSCNIYTNEGIKLGMVGDQQNSWMWCCAPHPNGNSVVVGCQDGTIAYYKLSFNTVHGLYRERYAYRENMTDVIIQHLITEQKVKIKCRDLIKKIAIYENRLAVQLPERIVIYELFSADTNDMHYKVKEKITQKLDCSLLVVCMEHLVVCQEKELNNYTFSGEKKREWHFESQIKYIKVIGGPPGQESLVLGLKHGQVWEISMDSPFPILKVTVNNSVRCLDVSPLRDKLAVVDDTGLCQVFNFLTGQLLYQEPDITTVSWNTEYEEMVAFSGTNTLAIKVSDFVPQREYINGFVVGLSGSKIFCLNGSIITSADLPLSGPLYQYIEENMFEEAYEIACLGVTDDDWEELAFSALESLELNVAKRAFMKNQDYKYLELIRKIEERQSRGENNKDIFIAEIYAHRGRFQEAADLFVKGGQEKRALEMFSSLHMFDEAQNYLGTEDATSLIRQKAEWAKNLKEYKAATELFISIGETQKAIDIMGEQGWTEQLIDLGRRLDKTEKDELILIADYLKKLNESTAAAEFYRRLGDSIAVLQLHVNSKEWSQAFAIVQKHPQHRALVYVPYARWLAESDKFVEAQEAFHMAGELEEAAKVLQQLMENAIDECRFLDAGYYYWILAKQHLDLAKERDQEKKIIEKFLEYEKFAIIYYAYNAIHRNLEDQFTSYLPEALFSIARFLMAATAKYQPKGVSLFSILYTLAIQSRNLGANKLSKQLFDKMQTLKIPAKFQQQVEIATISARARPYNDPEEFLPMCYRCSTYNPLVANSNNCVNCGQKFVYSFVSFEILPLVEFELEEGISDAEALRLIEAPPTNDSRSDGWQQEFSETHEALRFDEEEVDSFNAKLAAFQGGDNVFRPVIVDRNILLSMENSTVLVCKWRPPLRYKYYRNLLPEVQITLCHSCFKAFHVDDFELQVLQKGHCPFCRTSVDNGEDKEIGDGNFLST